MASKLNNVNIKIIHLVSGYIRLLNIVDQIIPSSITELCVQFYHSTVRILCLKHKKNITLADLDTDKQFELIPKAISINFQNYPFIHTSCGVCYIKDFKLPSHLLATSELLPDEFQINNTFDVIFTVGGSGGIKKCNAYMIDSKDYMTHNKSINLYCWALPQLQRGISQTYTLYSSKYGLISVGCSNTVSQPQLSFNILRFDEENISKEEWKWKQNTMQTARDALCATMISNDQLMCCGGLDKYKYVDMYDFITKQWTQLCDMHCKRRYSGICFDKYNERVYVGGGAEKPYKVEYYDIQKNKWILIGNTNGNHERFPVIWTDGANIVNIGSTWCKMLETIDLRENKWKNMFANDKGGFENLFSSDGGHTSSFYHKSTWIRDYHSRLCM
eukprot:354851_1